MKNLSMLVVFFLLLQGIVVGVREVRSAEFTAKFAHVLVADTPAGKAADRFAKLMAERTNGRMEVKVYPAGQLGNDTQIVEQIQLNTVQIGIPPTAVLGQFEPRMQLFDFPFIFPTREACYAVLDSEVGKILLDGLSKKGFKGTAYWESGFKQFTTKGKPITGPNDFKGLKIRTMDSPLLIDQYRAWGANPVPISFGETYNALQQRVVDGQENPLISIEKMKFYEVQDYLSIGDHAYLGYAVIVNQKFWDGLPKDIQATFQKTIEEVRDWEREESKNLGKSLIEKMEKAGIKVHYISAQAKKDFAAASMPVYKKYEKVVGKDLFDKATQVADQHSK
jgi:C4-dicarboxylate-binding protein DctP